MSDDYECKRCGHWYNDSSGYEHECEDVAAVRALSERVDLLEAALRSLEWCGHHAGFSACPSCDGYEPGSGADPGKSGHYPDCTLAAALDLPVQGQESAE